MTEEDNLKPSIIHAYHKMHETLTDQGLNEKDVLLLIQDRTRPKQSLTNIRLVIEGIVKLSDDLENKNDF